MTIFTRRTLLQGGTAAAAAGALTGPALLDWAKAWAQTAPWKPEQGAQLSMLRWKYFVQSEDDAFVALIDAFTKATGVKVNISRESYEDVQPKASVAANTGAGPDLFWGLYSLPHLFPQKCVDVTDVADYLGKKYGGWVPSAVTYGKSGNKWIAIPVCYSGNLMNYRVSRLAEGRLLQVPGDDRRVPGIRQGDEGEQHARRHGAGSRLGRRQRLGPLVPVGARRQPRRQERQGDHQLAGDREGAQLRQGALRQHDPRHRRLERRLQQQGVPRRRNLAGPTTASRSTSRPRRIRPRRTSPRTWTTPTCRSARSASRPSCT